MRRPPDGHPGGPTISPHDPIRLGPRTAAIAADLLAMADLALGRVDAAVLAVGRGDAAMAALVIAGDEAVDELCLRIESEVLSTQVRCAPVAADQRLLHVARIACVALERVGDLASAIAELAREGERMRLEGPLGALAEGAAGALARARAALAGEPGEAAGLAAEAVRARAALASLVGGGGWRPAEVLLGRHLERLVDNAAEIGRRAEFLATGRFPEAAGREG